MTTEFHQKGLSVEDWLEQDVPEGFRAELVDGELIVNPVPGYPHQKILFNLQRLFIPYLTDHPERVKTVLSPARTPIPGGNEGREPDMALYADEPRDPEKPDAWAQIRPILVIEVVSPKQERRDYVEKYTSYHLAEIPEYWIVDPQERRFTALCWAPQRWKQQVVEGQGIYRTSLLPGLTLEVADLWR